MRIQVRLDCGRAARGRRPGRAVSWIHVTAGPEEMYAISFFTGDEHGRITSVTVFRPEPYEPPAGREHLVER